MALASTNSWTDKVEKTIIAALRNHFGTSMNIYRSKNENLRGNQFVVLKGDTSEPQNTMYARLGANFFLTIEYYMADHLRNDNTVKKFFSNISTIEEVLYSLVEVDPLFNIEVSAINYEDDIEFQGYRKGQFELLVRNIR
jgi:hypothetical protein